MIKELYEKTYVRIMTGKVTRLTPEARSKLREEKLQERFAFEAKRMRGFELIYPSSSQSKNQVYLRMLNKANEIWDEYTTGKQKHRQRIIEA